MKQKQIGEWFVFVSLLQTKIFVKDNAADARIFNKELNCRTAQNYY
jgi:hypothetical protein